MAIRIKQITTTNSELNTKATNNQLLPGEVYIETDKKKIAAGTATNEYTEAMPSQKSATVDNLGKFNADGDIVDAGIKINNDGTSEADIWTAAKIKEYADTIAATSSSAILPPVQNINAAKALTGMDDKVLLNVEDSGLYRFDAESTVAADDNLILQPNTDTGRWLKMSSTINNHENLDGLQGGVAGNHYHLTQAQHTSATRNASGSQDGLLSNTDWNTFNNKAAGDHIHGNITNDGKIASGVVNRVVKTTTAGEITTMDVGSTSQLLRGDCTWVSTIECGF